MARYTSSKCLLQKPHKRQAAAVRRVENTKALEEELGLKDWQKWCSNSGKHADVFVKRQLVGLNVKSKIPAGFATVLLKTPSASQTTKVDMLRW